MSEEVWEDVFQVFIRVNDRRRLVASDMAIEDATLFAESWFLRNFNDQISSIEICRQPMDYYRLAYSDEGKKNETDI